MARAHFVKKARNDIPNTDIKKGDSYWWWQFAYSKKQCSKTKPKPAQLTRSEFYQFVYGIKEEIANLEANDGLEAARDEIVQQLRDQADELEGKRENMPEGLQESSTGELLQERADAMTAAADELDEIQIEEFDEDECRQECPAGEEDVEEYIESQRQAHWELILEELQAVTVEMP